MEQVYEGKEIVVGFAAQSTFQTATAGSGTYTEMFCDTVKIEKDIKRTDLATANGSKNMIHADTFIHTNGSMPRFATSGPFSYYHYDEVMYAFFQAVSEDATTPFTKTFTWFDTQPDFDTNNGKFLTFGKYFPGSSVGWRVKDCIASGLKLTLNRDELLMAEVHWVGNGAVDDATDFSGGTFERGLDGPGGSDAQSTQYGTYHFNQLDSVTLNIDGGGATGVILQSLTIDMNQEVEGLGPDGSGEWENYGVHSRSGTIELQLLKGTSFESALSSQESDGSCQLVLNFGSAGATSDGEMQWTVNFKMTEDPDTEEDAMLAGVIKGELSAPTASGDMVTAIMSNAIDRSY